VFSRFAIYANVVRRIGLAVSAHLAYPRRVPEFDDVAAFLDALSTRSETFATDFPRSWIFRGHGDERWSLTPSAFRSSAKLVEYRVHAEASWEKWTNGDQIRAESATLQRFIEEADGAGLPIPQESYDLRKEISEPFTSSAYAGKLESGDVEWPPRTTWPLIALAQHSGLSTRFLDWSYSSYVAAYFAAVDALTNEPRSERLAVWAFSTAARFAFWSLEHDLGTPREDFPEVVVAPYAGNPNLRAQEGVHIAVPITKIRWSSPADRSDLTPHLELVDQYARAFGHGALLKFTLPASEAGSLLWHLAKERVTAARLFPGYAGAAQSVLEQRGHVSPLNLL